MREVIFLAASMLAGACALPEALTIPPDQRCGEDNAARLSAADMTRLRTIDMVISEGEFRPMVLTLQQGRPYMLRIVNTDNENRLFAAPEFLFTAAVGEIRIGDRTTTNACLDRLSVPAGETTVMTLIPLRPGSYDFEDAFILPSGGVGIGAIRVHPDYSPAPPPEPIETS